MTNSALIADLLQCGFDVRFTATGTSMVPAISPGECVVARPAGAADVSEGDIVIYAVGDRLRAHRLVAIKRDGKGHLRYFMRGDNLDQADRPVEGAGIVGKLLYVERLWWKVPLTADADDLYAEAA